jgi:hypothetical protein
MAKDLKESGSAGSTKRMEKMVSRPAITGLEKLKVYDGPKGTKYEGKQRMEKGSESGSHYIGTVPSFGGKDVHISKKTTQEQITETGKYRDKQREKKYLKAALKSAKNKK